MKTLLIIPMAILELILLGANWVVALVSRRAGKAMMEWNMRTLPGPEWYSSQPSTESDQKENEK